MAFPENSVHRSPLITTGWTFMGLQVRSTTDAPKGAERIGLPTVSFFQQNTRDSRSINKAVISPQWTNNGDLLNFHQLPKSQLFVDGPQDFFRHCKMSSMNLKTRPTVRARERCSAKTLQSAQVHGTVLMAGLLLCWNGACELRSSEVAPS